MQHSVPHFLTEAVDLEQAITGVYDPLLVAFSILAAIVASYTALQISRMLRREELSILNKLQWLITGSLTMGVGIWSMHFIGMLAFSLPVPVHYDPFLTLLSVVPGIFASAVVMHLLARRERSLSRIFFSGLIQALGIGAMHYTGMAAMIADVDMQYHGGLFVLSIVIAYMLASGSLYIQHRVLNFSQIHKIIYGETFIAAVIMGLAISGMHYTGMAAAYYFPLAEAAVSHPDIISLQALVGLILLGTGAVFIVTLVVVFSKQSTTKIQNRYKAIFESTGDAIVLIDESGFIQAFNPAAAEIFGYLPEAVIGKSVTLLMPVNVASHHAEYLSNYSGSGKSHVVGKGREIQAQRSDGSRFSVEIKVREVTDPDGKRYFTGVIRDLTEERALQTKLLSAQKMESIGQLAAGVAHELNTPAQYVGDNLKFLNESFADLDILIDRFHQLHKAAESGSISIDLIREIRQKAETVDLNFLREEIPQALSQSLEGIESVSQIVRSMKEFSHQGSKEKEYIDINQMVQSAVNVSRNEWKYIADLELNLDRELPPVPCYVGEFNQALLNLLLNAAHAVGDVTTQQSNQKGKISIRTGLENQKWCFIEVSDTGCGMTKEISSRVFDPFFTTKEVGKGTGQGLAIAYSVIVEKHAGTIEVESEVDMGSTFTIRIPMVEQSWSSEEVS